MTSLRGVADPSTMKRMSFRRLQQLYHENEDKIWRNVDALISRGDGRLTSSDIRELASQGDSLCLRQSALLDECAAMHRECRRRGLALASL